MFETLEDRLVAEASISRALDILYEEFDDALMDGRGEEVDNYLRNANVSRYRVETLIGFLTITFAWTDSLKERSGFYDRVKTRVEGSYPDRAEKILMGLEGR
jgi:hypothetical protein